MTRYTGSPAERELVCLFASTRCIPQDKYNNIIIAKRGVDQKEGNMCFIHMCVRNRSV